MCLQCVTATSLHVHLSLNRAWYRHKNWFYGNFRILVPWTLHLNANLTDVRGTKVNKTGKCKTSFFPSPPAPVEEQLFEMQRPPFLGSTSTCINWFLAATSPADLHVLGPQWVEAEFQAQVPRNSIKGVVMYRCVKNTTPIQQEKSWQSPASSALPIFMSTLGAHRRCEGRAKRVLRLCSEYLGPKLVFFHTAFQENDFVFPTD